MRSSSQCSQRILPLHNFLESAAVAVGRGRKSVLQGCGMNKKNPSFLNSEHNKSELFENFSQRRAAAERMSMCGGRSHDSRNGLTNLVDRRSFSGRRDDLNEELKTGTAFALDRQLGTSITQSEPFLRGQRSGMRKSTENIFDNSH